MKSLAKSKHNESPLKAILIKNTGVNDCYLQRGWKVTMLQICSKYCSLIVKLLCMIVLDILKVWLWYAQCCKLPLHRKFAFVKSILIAKLISSNFRHCKNIRFEFMLQLKRCSKWVLRNIAEKKNAWMRNAWVDVSLS